MIYGAVDIDGFSKYGALVESSGKFSAGNSEEPDILE